MTYNGELILDSVATNHTTGDIKSVIKCDRLDLSIKITLGNGSKLTASH